MDAKIVDKNEPSETSSTIDNDVRSVIAECPIDELISEIEKAALASQIILPENVSEILTQLQSTSGSVGTFRDNLKQLQQEHPQLYNLLMKTIFEFIGNLDTILDLTQEWSHGLDVMAWKLDRMSDRMRRLTDHIAQSTEDLGQI